MVCLQLGGQSDLAGSLLGALSGKQELSVQNVVSMVQSSGGDSLLQHAQDRGLDPALLNGVMGIISSAKSGGGGGAEDGADGGGFDLGRVIKMVGGLTNKGTEGSGADGFMQLLEGFGGSGGRIKIRIPDQFQLLKLNPLQEEEPPLLATSFRFCWDSPSLISTSRENLIPTYR